MAEIRELSFCELKRKDIVSICDGRKLGRIIDLVFTPEGRVQGIVAPYGRKFLFLRSQEVYIPYCNIKTIGEDIILVDISLEGHQNSVDHGRAHHYQNPPPPVEPPSDKPSTPRPSVNECDFRCDKCMLFDCENRWKKRNSVYVDNAPYND